MIFLTLAVVLITAASRGVESGAVGLAPPGDPAPLAHALRGAGRGGLAVLFTAEWCGEPCAGAVRAWGDAAALSAAAGRRSPHAPRGQNSALDAGGSSLDALARRADGARATFAYVDCDAVDGGADLCDESEIDELPGAVWIPPSGNDDAGGSVHDWVSRAVRIDTRSGRGEDIAAQILRAVARAAPIDHDANLDHDENNIDNETDDDDEDDVDDNGIAGRTAHGENHVHPPTLAAPLAGVRELTAADFRSAVASKPTAVVLFRSAAHPGTRKAGRAAELAADVIDGEAAVFAAVDCLRDTATSDLCAQERVRDLPAFVVYLAGVRLGPIRAAEGAEIDSVALVAAVQDPRTATAASAAQFAPSMSRATGGVEGIRSVLTEFEGGSSRVVVVAFVSGDCAACDEFSSIFEDAAAAVEPGSGVVFSVSDCGDPPDTSTIAACARFAPVGFPTVVVFTRRSAVAYAGDLDAFALARFAAARAWIGGGGGKRRSVRAKSAAARGGGSRDFPHEEL